MSDSSYLGWGFPMPQNPGVWLPASLVLWPCYLTLKHLACLLRKAKRILNPSSERIQLVNLANRHLTPA